MRVKVETAGPCTRALTIEISPEEVAGHREAVYRTVQQRVTVPGFRKGHAPRDLLEVHHGARAQRDLVDRLLLEGYRQALRETGLHPVTDPDIRDVTHARDGVFSFSATVEVRPEVQVREYRGLPTSARLAVVTDEMVAEALRALQGRAATYLAVTDRPVRAGDIAVCDITCTADGQRVEQRQGVWVTMDREAALPEVVVGLDGAVVGEARTVQVTLPSEFPDPRVAGKAATCTVVLREVKERRLPELNDEFAKDLGVFETLAALTERVRADLQQREQVRVHQEVERGVLDALLGRASFDLPPSQVARELARIVEEALAHVRPEEREAQATELTRRLEPAAQRAVRLSYLIEHIASQEGITVTDEELAQHIAGLRPQDPQAAQRFDRLLAAPAVPERFRRELRVRKTVQWLVSVARVTPATAGP